MIRPRFLISLLGLILGGSFARAQLSQAPVSSSDATITFGQSFSPSYSGGSGTGNWQFVIAGYTNWNPQPNGLAGTDVPGIGYSTSWTPPGAGSYAFYVAKCGDIDYANSNISGPWTLTVAKASQSNVGISASATTVPAGTTVNFTASGGSGGGGWVWTGANGSGTGASATFGSAGTYTVSVYHQGDANYNDSNTASVSIRVVVVSWMWSFTSSLSPSYYPTTGNTYNVSVGVNDGGGFPYVTLYKYGAYMAGGWYGTQANTADGVGNVSYSADFSDSLYGMNGSNSASVYVYSLIQTTFNFSGGPNFTYDGGTKSVSVSSSSNPGGATYSTGGTYSASAVGTYTATATAYGSYTGSGSYSWTISAAPQGAVGISPTSQTVNVGQSITFTASGGSGTGAYTWGGDASGTGASNTVTFNTPGTRTVTVYRAGDGNYIASNTATATITVNAAAPAITTQPQSLSANAGGTVTFSVTASGTAPLSYQWRKNTGNISGATGSSLTLTNVQSADAANYDVVVSNSYGSATSSAATLTVVYPPAITSAASASGTVNTAFSYQITATNNPTSYNATSLTGTGLSVNTSTGLISGTPTKAGTFTFTISATNAAGTGSGTLVLTITFGSGDLTTNAFQYDKTNRLKQSPGGSYSQDAEGNIKSTGP